MVQDSNHPSTHERASTIGTADMSPEEKRKKVGNYLILRTIGEGSFAKVRIGYHLITEMKVRRRRNQDQLLKDIHLICFSSSFILLLFVVFVIKQSRENLRRLLFGHI